MVGLRYASLIQIADKLLRRSKSNNPHLPPQLVADINQLLKVTAKRLQRIDRIFTQEALDKLSGNHSSIQAMNWLERNASSVSMCFFKHGRFHKIWWSAKHDDSMLRDVVLEERKRQKYEQ